MATSRIGQAAPLVIESEAHYWSAIGTREQLLCAGLCTPAHFPEGRKRYAACFDGPRHWRIEARKGGRWNLRVFRSEDEAKQIKVRHEAAESAAQGPQAWRDSFLKFSSSLSRVMRAELRGESLSSGYRVSERDVLAFDALVRRMTLLIQNAEVVPCVEASAGQNPLDELPRLRAPLSLVCAREMTATA